MFVTGPSSGLRIEIYLPPATPTRARCFWKYSKRFTKSSFCTKCRQTTPAIAKERVCAFGRE